MRAPTVTRSFFAISRIGPSLGLAFCLLGALVFLPLLWLVLEDERTELQTKVNVGSLAAGFAVEQDASILDVYVGLGILALLAKNELLDEPIKLVLKFSCLMGAVNDPTVVSGVRVGLGSELETEILDDIYTNESATLTLCAGCRKAYMKVDEPESRPRCSD